MYLLQRRPIVYVIWIWIEYWDPLSECIYTDIIAYLLQNNFFGEMHSFIFYIAHFQFSIKIRLNRLSVLLTFLVSNKASDSVNANDQCGLF